MNQLIWTAHLLIGTVFPLPTSDSFRVFWDIENGQSEARQEEELERITRRFNDEHYKALWGNASWAVIHSANPSERQKAFEVLKEVYPINKSVIESHGGIDEVKRKVGTLLSSKDDIVRGFGAIFLGIIGDRTYKARIAALLPNAHAAIALGLLEADEYANDLSRWLDSSNPEYRRGAVIGLGHMCSHEHASAIASLLNDKDVQVSAIRSLTRMNAKQFMPDIAKLLKKGHGEVAKVAAYGLVKLQGKEYAKDIAALLADGSSRGDAAKALALMGASEYADALATLSGDENSLVRSDAALALGILNDKKHENTLRRLLQDREGFVKGSAAAALLLMNAEHDIKNIKAVLRESGYEEYNPVGLHAFDVIVADEAHAVSNRLKEKFTAAPANECDPR